MFPFIFRSSLIITTYLVMFSSSAFAVNWLKIGGSSDVDVYVDIETITRSGDKAECWILWDYKKPQVDVVSKKRYLSAITLSYYYCKSKSSAVKSNTKYSGSFGQGNVVYSFEMPFELSSSRLIPGTLGEAMCDFVCGYKSEKDQ